MTRIISWDSLTPAQQAQYGSASAYYAANPDPMLQGMPTGGPRGTVPPGTTSTTANTQ